MKNYYITLDIGGTKTSGAIFSRDGKILEDYVYVTPSKTFDGEEAVYQNTKSVADHLIRHFRIGMDEVEGMGVGCPGPLDRKTGVILHAPMMRWKNFPLVERLKEDFQVPVYLDNDGNLGALAEQRCGVAKGEGSVFYMTVSTGCGGGFVKDGEIYHGAKDAALEIGHMCVEMEGRKCPCGARGCFELYASGTALNKEANNQVFRHKDSLLYGVSSEKTGGITGKDILEAARKEDAFAMGLYRKEGEYLGVGVGNILRLFDPSVVVLGGGVTKAKEFFHTSLIDTLKDRGFVHLKEDRIRYSKLNDKVVLYGAYYLAKEGILEG